MNFKSTLIVVLAALLTVVAVGCAGSYAESRAEAPGYYKGDSSYDASYGGEAAPVAVASDGWAEEESDYDGAYDSDDSDRSMPIAPEPAPARGTVTAPPVKTLDKANGNTEQGAPDKASDSKEEEAPVIGQRIIIYVADIGLYVFEIDATLKKAIALSIELGGWVQQSTSNTVLLRIPAQHFQTVLAEFETLGDVSYKNITGTDVTEEFLDTQLRLKNAMVLRDRYVELLAKAKNVEESLLIEKELGRITEEIERMKGRLKFLRDHAAYSTIKLLLQKKTDEPPHVTRVALPFDWLQSYRLENVLY